MKLNSRAASAPPARRPMLNPARRAMLNIDQLPLPYVEMNADGVITRANRAALALQHPEQGNLIGSSAWNTMAIDEKDHSAAAFLSLMVTGEQPPVISRSLFDRSGKFRTYEIHRSMMRTPQGKPAGVRMIFMDVTERKNALDEARRSSQWFESAIGSVADAVVLTDILGLVLSANPAAEALLGLDVHELEGKVIEETVPILEYRPLAGPVLDRRAAIETCCKGIATLLLRNGSKLNVEISTSPILNKNSGSVSGVAAILRRIEDSF